MASKPPRTSCSTCGKLFRDDGYPQCMCAGSFGTVVDTDNGIKAPKKSMQAAREAVSTEEHRTAAKGLPSSFEY